MYAADEDELRGIFERYELANLALQSDQSQKVVGAANEGTCLFCARFVFFHSPARHQAIAQNAFRRNKGLYKPSCVFHLQYSPFYAGTYHEAR